MCGNVKDRGTGRIQVTVSDHSGSYVAERIGHVSTHTSLRMYTSMHVLVMPCRVALASRKVRLHC